MHSTLISLSCFLHDDIMKWFWHIYNGTSQGMSDFFVSTSNARLISVIASRKTKFSHAFEFPARRFSSFLSARARYAKTRETDENHREPLYIRVKFTSLVESGYALLPASRNARAITSRYYASSLAGMKMRRRHDCGRRRRCRRAAAHYSRHVSILPSSEQRRHSTPFAYLPHRQRRLFYLTPPPLRRGC